MEKILQFQAFPISSFQFQETLLILAAPMGQGVDLGTPKRHLAPAAAFQAKFPRKFPRKSGGAPAAPGVREIDFQSLFIFCLFWNCWGGKGQEIPVRALCPDGPSCHSHPNLAGGAAQPFPALPGQECSQGSSKESPELPGDVPVPRRSQSSPAAPGGARAGPGGTAASLRAQTPPGKPKPHPWKPKMPALRGMSCFS